jgi:hypothetical protein
MPVSGNDWDERSHHRPHSRAQQCVTVRLVWVALVLVLVALVLVVAVVGMGMGMGLGLGQEQARQGASEGPCHHDDDPPQRDPGMAIVGEQDEDAVEEKTPAVQCSAAQRGE